MRMHVCSGRRGQLCETESVLVDVIDSTNTGSDLGGCDRRCEYGVSAGNAIENSSTESIMIVAGASSGRFIPWAAHLGAAKANAANDAHRLTRTG